MKRKKLQKKINKFYKLAAQIVKEFKSKKNTKFKQYEEISQYFLGY